MCRKALRRTSRTRAKTDLNNARTRRPEASAGVTRVTAMVFVGGWAILPTPLPADSALSSRPTLSVSTTTQSPDHWSRKANGAPRNEMRRNGCLPVGALEYFKNSAARGTRTASGPARHNDGRQAPACRAVDLIPVAVDCRREGPGFLHAAKRSGGEPKVGCLTFRREGGHLQAAGRHLCCQQTGGRTVKRQEPHSFGEHMLRS